MSRKLYRQNTLIKKRNWLVYHPIITAFSNVAVHSHPVILYIVFRFHTPCNPIHSAYLCIHRFRPQSAARNRRHRASRRQRIRCTAVWPATNIRNDSMTGANDGRARVSSMFFSIKFSIESKISQLQIVNSHTPLSIIHHPYFTHLCTTYYAPPSLTTPPSRPTQSLSPVFRPLLLSLPNPTVPLLTLRDSPLLPLCLRLCLWHVVVQ